MLALAGTGVLVIACASGEVDVRKEGQDAFVLPPAQLISCPNFQLDSTTFVVTDTGGTFLIKPNHYLEFGDGAVSKPTQFTVTKSENAAPPHNRAEVRITRGDEETTFHGDVLLDLSYASCQGLDSDTLTLVKTNPPRKPVGGRNDRDRKMVRALLPHLSMFAIAR